MTQALRPAALPSPPRRVVMLFATAAVLALTGGVLMVLEPEPLRAAAEEAGDRPLELPLMVAEPAAE